MANQLFQQARHFTATALTAPTEGRQEAIAKAKNALSSAYANSTRAEQIQLGEMQSRLDNLE
ncbi:hypothetical protein AM500_20400 [Bacillus sp. FJAT-18017]|jgi:Protein of unknown function (DUF3813)|uniref:DUF3813 domain-containing protein n=1 Tax=Bacillus sp. FJAT-18017 TaxID=1705566 RepID=UPI0006AF979D|nr:DUF3813 domain-containing protein [Bacillus sp. FJAT-18017]ALC91887.1 hypothetical protein AM500_20400 [Bacillus sp. FJAT-18017]